MLRALVLALDDDARGQVREAHGRVGLVDVLAAGAGGAVGVDAQVRRIDLLGLDLVDLGQHGHGAGRRVDAALRLRGGHALHAMGAGLELERGVDAAARDAADDLLVAAVLALARAQDLDGPAHGFGVLRVHAEQVAGEDGGFVAARAGADLEVDVALVVRVGRDQRLLQLQLERFVALLECSEFLFTHRTNIGVAVFDHLSGGGHVRVNRLVIGKQLYDRFDARILLRQIAELVLVADHIRIGEQPGEFLEAVAHGLQLVAYRLLHWRKLTLLRGRTVPGRPR